MVNEVKKLDPSLVASRQEVPFEINIRGLAKAYSKVFHDAPVDFFRAIARKVDVVSKNMMTGYSSAVSMPIGIMLRNGARVASEATSAGRFSGIGILAGAIGACASIYFGTTLGAEYLQTAVPALSGTVGSVGTYIVAGSASALLAATPAFTAGELVTASILSAAATAVSVLPAAVNLPVAMRRSKDRAMGIVYDNTVFDEKVERESLDTQFRAKKLSNVLSEMNYLSEDQKQTVYKRLSDDFTQAAQHKADEEAKAARKTAKTAKPMSIQEALDANQDDQAVLVRGAPKGPAATPQ